MNFPDTSNLNYNDIKNVDKFIEDIKLYITNTLNNSLGLTESIRQALASRAIDIYNNVSENIKLLDTDQTAKLRSLSCNMFANSINNINRPISMEEYAILIRFNTKSGQAWTLAEQADKAISFLKAADNYWNMMLKNYPQAADKDIYLFFSIKYSEMELAWNTNNTQDAISHAKEVQKIINNYESLKSELELFIKAIYNHVIKLYIEKDYPDTLEYIKIISNLINENTDQQRYLKLIRISSLCLKQLENYEEALTTINIAYNKEPSNTDNIFIIIELLIFLDRLQAAEDYLKILINSNSINVAQCITACEFFKEKSPDRMQKALSLLHEKSPNNEILVFTQIKNLLLTNNFVEAFKTLEEKLPHFKNDISTNPPVETMALVWDAVCNAVSLWNSKKYEETAKWLELYCNLVPETDKIASERINRALSLTYYQMNNFEEATKYAYKLISLSNNAAESFLLLIRAQIKIKNSADVKDSIQRLLRAADFETDHLLIALGFCGADEEYKLMIYCIENLINAPNFESMKKLKALQCLLNIYLTLTPHELSELNVQNQLTFKFNDVVYPLKSASKLIDEFPIDNTNFDTYLWIANFSWNFAIDTSKLYLYDISLQLFEASGKLFSNLLNFNIIHKVKLDSYIQITKMNYIMIASLGLELLKTSDQSDHENIDNIVTSIKAAIELCKANSSKYPSEQSGTDKSAPLIFMLEFQIMHYNEDPNCLSFLEKGQTDPSLSSSIFEICAQSVMNSKNPNNELSKYALNIAINLTLKTKSNINKLPTIYRNLLQLISFAERKESWEIYKSINDILKDSKNYELLSQYRSSESESKYLIYSSWNIGVKLYQLQQYEDAILWMKQSINFHDILQLQNGKEKQMSEMIADLKIAEFRSKGISLTPLDQSYSMQE